MNQYLLFNGVALAAVACALALPAGPALSQSPRITPAPQVGGLPSLDQRRAELAVRRDKAQVLWDTWRANPRAAKNDSLEQISALGGLRPTKENTTALIEAMRTLGTPLEKSVLASMAGQLYRDLDDQGDKQSQEMVRTYIAQVASREMEPQVWKAAAFTYSRMGWFSDSMQVFTRAKYIWGDRNYYGELAHAVVSAPQAEQIKIIKELEAGDTRFGGGFNDFGKEILASQLTNDHAVKALHPEAARAVLAMFNRKPPAFPAELEKIGVSDLAAYREWMMAVVALTANANGEPPKNVLARMIDVNGDPRKLIAVLPDSRTHAALDQKSLAAIDANLASYGAKYKADANLQGFVANARSELAVQK